AVVGSIMDFFANDAATAAVCRIRHPLCVFLAWELSFLGGAGSIHAKADRDSHVVSNIRDTPYHLDGRASSSAGLRGAHLSGVFHRRVEGQHPDDYHYAP